MKLGHSGAWTLGLLVALGLLLGGAWHWRNSSTATADPVQLAADNSAGMPHVFIELKLLDNLHVLQNFAIIAGSGSVLLATAMLVSWVRPVKHRAKQRRTALCPSVLSVTMP